MRLPFTNQGSNCWCCRQDLDCGDAPSIHLPDELLRDDGLQRRRELGAHLGLLFCWKCIDKAVDRTQGAPGVQRSEHKVSSLR